MTHNYSGGAIGSALSYIVMKKVTDDYNKHRQWVLYEARFDPVTEAFVPYRRIGAD